ncbi:MAG: YceI family protein [Bacteroidetes bacterium]|nr:YceI family protein [Bacteroidota bacterium]
MKLLTLLTPAALLALAFAGTQYKVAEDSTMTISGGSTIHDWHCDAKVVGEMDRAESGESAVPTAVKIRVAVDEIECGKGVMNKKLRDALKSDKNPDVLFTLDTASLEGTGKLATTGNLTIAGKTKPVEFVVTEKATDSGLTYEGSVDLLMTDFDVKPPTAMMGTMKTKDEVTVSFSVNMVTAK